MDTRGRRFSAIVIIVWALFGSLVFAAPDAVAVGAEGESWPSFNESDGCGSPWMRGSNVQTAGSLAPETLVRGPYGDYFGRTIAAIESQLRWWDVPMSDDESLRIHQRLTPALALVKSALARAETSGLWYPIYKKQTFAYTPRTVRGSYRISQHGLGASVDINSTYNPYSSSNKLTTDMPGWFVDIWRSAGFCWGGNWIDLKDPMHFSWRGPLFTPGMTTLPPATDPLTSIESFSRMMHTKSVPTGPNGTRFRLLMDGDLDGAVDVVQVVETPTASLIDIISAGKGYRGCAVSRYPVGSVPDAVAAIPGDWNRDGAMDLWLINDQGGLSITAYNRATDFATTETVSVNAAAGNAYLSADHNVDGWSDLYILSYGAGQWSVTVMDGRSRFSAELASGNFAGDAALTFTALDRNRDQIPDLVGVGGGGSLIIDGASSFSTTDTLPAIAGPFDDIAGTDYDGDGRHDLVTLSGGTLRVYAGNSPLPGVSVTSWFEWPTFGCSAGALPYPYAGWFRDDEASVHESNIDTIATTAITYGCNPPYNDRFCTNRTITKGQLAAFIARALDLQPGAANTFVDDNGHLFEPDIERLVAAGMILPCNSAGNAFCPDEPLTREEMARFLVAAFGFAPSGINRFTDDGDSPYESQIDAIAAVGVTLGCNPPASDHFCPDGIVTRAQMASFFIRALAHAD
ncbi:MAG: M15 family metallopeptidase [Acidimicrobiia bacterium]|nr:M15 family metallopeptidase [Acidimicrobiia bacterium]